VNEAVKQIGARPFSFPRLHGVPDDLLVRRALVHRFPFALVFIETPNALRIIAVAHVRRQPGYWLERIFI
jgi:hypothetical protein